MASSSLGRAPTCLNCLRRIAQPATSPLSLTQTRGRSTMTKAELEDLQGIPVRLLRSVPGFGREEAIIRVKRGRMRNNWYPKGIAEYMTKMRFAELGLTQAAIGVRDRSFGIPRVLRPDSGDGKTGEGRRRALEESAGNEGRKKQSPVLTLNVEDTHTLLTQLVPEILTFSRKVIPTAPVEPAATAPPAPKRSPSLAASASTSTEALEAESSAEGGAAAAAAPSQQHPEEATPIFGSVSAVDILAAVKESLLAAEDGSHVHLEADNITIRGLDEGEDRIKRLGQFVVDIAAAKDSEPVTRIVEVVAEE